MDLRTKNTECGTEVHIAQESLADPYFNRKRTS